MTRLTADAVAAIAARSEVAGQGVAFSSTLAEALRDRHALLADRAALVEELAEELAEIRHQRDAWSDTAHKAAARLAEVERERDDALMSLHHALSERDDARRKYIEHGKEAQDQRVELATERDEALMSLHHALSERDSWRSAHATERALRIEAGRQVRTALRRPTDAAIAYGNERARLDFATIQDDCDRMRTKLAEVERERDMLRRPSNAATRQLLQERNDARAKYETLAGLVRNGSKHGPGGSGEPGPCPTTCPKCYVEKTDKETTR